MTADADGLAAPTRPTDSGSHAGPADAEALAGPLTPADLDPCEVGRSIAAPAAASSAPSARSRPRTRISVCRRRASRGRGFAGRSADQLADPAVGVDFEVRLSEVRVRETGELRARDGRSLVLRASAGGTLDFRRATVDGDAPFSARRGPIATRRPRGAPAGRPGASARRAPAPSGRGREDAVDHVCDPVGSVHVGAHDGGVVDLHGAAVDGDGEALALDRFELLAVLELSAVSSPGTTW